MFTEEKYIKIVSDKAAWLSDNNEPTSFGIEKMKARAIR